MKVIVNEKTYPIKIATTFYTRLKGFMFYQKPIDFGLCFPNCRSVHTFFMYQPIDIIMTDKNHIIIAFFKEIPSNKLIKGPKNTYYTYELPPNTIEKIEIGTKLNRIGA